MLKLNIEGIHYKLTDDDKKYIEQKIGSLDRFVGRHAKTSAHAEIKLKGSYYKKKYLCTCEVVLHLPHEVLRVEESSASMNSAIDLTQSRLKIQLKKYKDKYSPSSRRHIVGRLLRRVRR